MARLIVDEVRGYTVMKNHHLRNKDLSLKAIGLMSKMLSLPPDWDYTVEGLVLICKEGKDAIQNAIIELEKAGYIERSRTRDERGRLCGTDYVVHQVPVAGLPMRENPAQVNPRQINKDIINNLDNNPPIVPPKGETGGRSGKGSRREAKAEPDWKPERWAAFWESYPRHEGKQKAIAAWDRLKPDDRLLTRMALGLARQLASEEWNRGIGIPYASTWLNQQRWTDEGLRLPAQAQAADASGWAEDEEVLTG